MYSQNSKVEVFFQRALARCKLPRIRVHDLRHIFASHYVMAGGDIFTLQRILGHSTPQLTSDTYAHLSPDHLAREADRVAYPMSQKTATVIEFRSESSSTRTSVGATSTTVPDTEPMSLARRSRSKVP
jgi:hypothetical protein